VIPLSFLALIQSHGVAANCYYDAYGSYYCNTVGLAIGVRVAIGVVVFVVCAFILSILVWRRRRAQMITNAILLQRQQQQQQPNQWAAPPGGAYPAPPYPNNGYPVYSQNTGGYPNNGSQPFQPGYTGGYTGAEAAKGYDANLNGTPLQEPARSYNPEQPYPAAYSPSPVPAPAPAPAPLITDSQPPSYFGYNAAPPQATGGSNPPTNPYTYNPPDTHKV